MLMFIGHCETMHVINLYLSNDTGQASHEFSKHPPVTGSDAGNFVQRCLQAGADPSKPQDSQGTRPLQLLCQLSVAGFRA